MSFARNLPNKYRKQLLDTATKTGLGALKTDSKKVFHKPAETTGELIGNKIADKTVEPKPVPKKYFTYVVYIIPKETREEILDELGKVLQNLTPQGI